MLFCGWDHLASCVRSSCLAQMKLWLGWGFCETSLPHARHPPTQFDLMEVLMERAAKHHNLTVAMLAQVLGHRKGLSHKH